MVKLLVRVPLSSFDDYFRQFIRVPLCCAERIPVEFPEVPHALTETARARSWRVGRSGTSSIGGTIGLTGASSGTSAL